MIPRHVPHRDAKLSHDLIVGLVEIEQIRHEIAQRHAKCSVCPDQFVDHVIRHVIDVAQVVRLRVSQHHDLELVRFRPLAQREVD